MNAHDWMRHAALLDAQPSNRRLVQQNPTTRWQPADMARADWADRMDESVCRICGPVGLVAFAGLIFLIVFH